MTTFAHGNKVPIFGVEYQLADLTMAGKIPYWAVHTLHDDGNKSSWILHVRQEDDGLVIDFDIWFPEAIQAIIGDVAGYVWAITTSNEMITNAPVKGDSCWTQIENHPHIQHGGTWHSRGLSFVSDGLPRPDLAVCMMWTDHTLLIGTFNRCLYRWDGKVAVLEYDPQAPAYSGGINDIVMTARGVCALGYGGAVLRRSSDSTWTPLKAPWSDSEAEYVNVVAGAEGPDGELWVVAAGGWVFATDEQGLHAIHRIPAEPLGIAKFQGNLYLSTLDGCYQLRDAGSLTLIKRGIAMGKAIDAGTMLMAVDVDPREQGHACAHIWLRTRSADRWSTQIVG